jgi:hypothetical protein
MGHRLILWVVTDISEEHAASIFGNVGNPVRKSQCHKSEYYSLKSYHRKNNQVTSTSKCTVIVQLHGLSRQQISGTSAVCSLWVVESEWFGENAWHYLPPRNESYSSYFVTTSRVTYSQTVNLFKQSVTNIFHETATCRNPPTHNF